MKLIFIRGLYHQLNYKKYRLRGLSMKTNQKKSIKAGGKHSHTFALILCLRQIMNASSQQTY